MVLAPARHIRSVALAAMCFATLVSCGGGEPPKRAGTVGDQAPSAQEQDGQTATGDQDLSRAGRELTQKEARAALPTIADMPTGWSVDPEDTLTGEDEDENDSKMLPARCERVFEGLDHVTEKTEPAAESAVTYTGGAIGPFLGVEISSHEEVVSDQLFKDVLTAFDRCSQFKVDDGQEIAQVSASPLSFPNVGDESIAIRFDMDSQSFTAGFDLVAIRVGHNVIGLSQLGIGGAPDVKPLVRAAKTTMQKLSR